MPRPSPIGSAAASFVVKAQIHAGGRGKGGGVKVVKGPAEAAATAAKILGMTLVTHQTGPSGQIVQRVLIEQGLRSSASCTSGSSSTAPPSGWC